MKKFHLAWFGGTGPGGWMKPSARLYDWRQPDIYQDVARLCERAKFDMVLFADNLAIPTVLGGSRDWYLRHGSIINFDPLPTMAMMAAVTNRIGLTSTLSSTFYPPFMLARLLATLDHLTRGRVGWNLVTTASRDSAQNFGYDELLEHDERYDRADEYVQLCRALWDSWEPDAVVMDQTNHIFADPSKVHEINFEGKYFRSRGPLTVSSSPQRHPVISVAGTSGRGQKFAVQHGDMAIAHKNTVADMRKYVQGVRAGLTEVGRDPSSMKVFFSIKPVLGDTEAMAQERWAANYEQADPHHGLAIISNFLGMDLAGFDLDSPLPDNLKVQGIVGTLQRYQSLPAGSTLRTWAKDEALYETFRICGTPEQVADVLEETVRETDCDGFHFRPFGGVTDYEYLLEITTKLIPILQDRELTRREYSGSTLRHHLFEF